MSHNQLTEGQVERRLWSVLMMNGEETLRETAKRLGLAPSSLHVFMRRQGYRAKAVTVWERVDGDVHPTLPIGSRENPPEGTH